MNALNCLCLKILVLNLTVLPILCNANEGKLQSIRGSQILLKIPSGYSFENTSGQYMSNDSSVFLTGMTMPARDGQHRISISEAKMQLKFGMKSHNTIAVSFDDLKIQGHESFIATIRQSLGPNVIEKKMLYVFHDSMFSTVILMAYEKGMPRLEKDYQKIFNTVEISKYPAASTIPFSIKYPKRFNHIKQFASMYVFQVDDKSPDLSKGGFSVYIGIKGFDTNTFEITARRTAQLMSAKLDGMKIEKFNPITIDGKRFINIELAGVDKKTQRQTKISFCHLLYKNSLWTFESIDDSSMNSDSLLLIAESFSLKAN